VIGASLVGGLIGHQDDDGFTNSSFSASNVTGEERVGGLVGESGGTSISNSYSTGNVTGMKEIGGLSGFGWYPPIRSSYSISAVSGTETVGGLVGGGDAWEEHVSGNFYNMETSGQSKCHGKENIGGNTGKSTAAMKQKSTFAGWDFEDTWGIDSDINNGYPHLLGIDY
jgi:hypothetical protein